MVSRGGASARGLGDGTVFHEDGAYCLCECYVEKVEGRWCITREFVINGEDAIRRRTKNLRPFAKSLLEFYDGLEEAEGNTDKEAQ